MSQKIGNHTDEGMAEHRRMMREHQGKTLWSYWTSVMLGTWLVATAIGFPYGSRALAWSDGLSGLTVITLGLLTLRPKWDNLRWGTCLIAGVARPAAGGGPGRAWRGSGRAKRDGQTDDLRRRTCGSRHDRIPSARFVRCPARTRRQTTATTG
jgi:hypothetical protein